MLYGFIAIQGEKFKTEFGEMIQHERKCIPQIIFRFQAVMEDNDGSLRRMLDDILKAILRRDILIKITTQHIPHDNVIMALQELDLAGA